MDEEGIIKKKAFKFWRSYIKRRLTEGQIVRRFREFKKRLLLTKCFITWHEAMREQLTFLESKGLSSLLKSHPSLLSSQSRWVKTNSNIYIYIYIA